MKSVTRVVSEWSTSFSGIEPVRAPGTACAGT